MHFFLLAAIGIAGFVVAEDLWSEKLKRWIAVDKKQALAFLLLLSIVVGYDQERQGNAQEAHNKLAQQGLRDKLSAEQLRSKGLDIRLENESRERESLTKAIAPRMLSIQWQEFARFTRFKPMSVATICANDPESIHTEGQLAFLFAQSEWSIVSRNKADDGVLFDGIKVEHHIGARRENDQGQAAAEELVSFLKEQGIEASTFPGDESIAENAIVVKVGSLPADYFSDRLTPKQK